MNTILIETRPARPADAPALAEAHDDSWRNAYQGLIPGPELEKLVTRRGAAWWETAIRRGSRISLLMFGDEIAGYANYGKNRAKSLPYAGEVYELYLKPEYQGLGFGRRLFSAAKRDLAQAGQTNMVVWVLSDNEPAVAFYRALGGRTIARSTERFGTKVLDKIAFAWTR
jgi:ribosomal protein S18 acetylase RimI-like enzyme